MTVRDDGLSRSFDEWYRLEWPRLVATFTLACGERELGREIAAEALTRALERWSRVGKMASPGGWTYRVGVNLLRRHHRRSSLELRVATGTVSSTLNHARANLRRALSEPTEEIPNG